MLCVQRDAVCLSELCARIREHRPAHSSDAAWSAFLRTLAVFEENNGVTEVKDLLLDFPSRAALRDELEKRCGGPCAVVDAIMKQKEFLPHRQLSAGDVGGGIGVGGCGGCGGCGGGCGGCGCGGCGGCGGGGGVCVCVCVCVCVRARWWYLSDVAVFTDRC
jgi:hypothetical protein